MKGIQLMPQANPVHNLELIKEKIEALHTPFKYKLHTFGDEYDACKECTGYTGGDSFSIKVKYPCKTLKIIWGEL
jgi:hypothetical protein